MFIVITFIFKRFLTHKNGISSIFTNVKKAALGVPLAPAFI